MILKIKKLIFIIIIIKKNNIINYINILLKFTGMAANKIK